MESLDEIDFIARSEHRTAVLDALAEGPRDRHDLRQRTGASSPTIGRILADFEDRQWLERDGPTYTLTPLGEYVAAEFGSLRQAMDVERKLRDVWKWLPREMAGFSVELFENAVVSYPGQRYPYEPVERVKDLIENADEMRGFGTTVFKSINNETICRAVLDGTEFEYVYDPAVLEATVAWNPERVAEAAMRENCTILLCDDLPDNERCGIGIFDERSGICCHDAETGMLEAIVDTEAPETREWVESVFERYRAEARPLDGEAMADLFPQELLA